MDNGNYEKQNGVRAATLFCLPHPGSFVPSKTDNLVCPCGTYSISERDTGSYTQKSQLGRHKVSLFLVPIKSDRQQQWVG